jgi:hypothetical protein
MAWPTLGLDLAASAPMNWRFCLPDHPPFVVVAADSAVGAEAPPRIACTLSSIDMYSAWMGGCLQ